MAILLSLRRFIWGKIPPYNLPKTPLYVVKLPHKLHIVRVKGGHIMKVSGIYKIENKVNGKIYVGSSKDIKNRWMQHKRELNKNTHHSVKLQRAWNKYGEENFEFSILEECAEDKRLYLEQYYIDKFKSFFEGYNCKERTKDMYTEEDYKMEQRNKEVCLFFKEFTDKFHVVFTDKNTNKRIMSNKTYEYENVYISDIFRFVLRYAIDSSCILIENNTKLDKDMFIDFNIQRGYLRFNLLINNIALRFEYILNDRFILFNGAEENKKRSIFDSNYTNEYSECNDYVDRLFDMGKNEVNYNTDLYFDTILRISKNNIMRMNHDKSGCKIVALNLIKGDFCLTDKGVQCFCDYLHRNSIEIGNYRMIKDGVYGIKKQIS